MEKSKYTMTWVNGMSQDENERREWLKKAKAHKESYMEAIRRMKKKALLPTPECSRIGFNANVLIEKTKPAWNISRKLVEPKKSPVQVGRAYGLKVEMSRLPPPPTPRPFTVEHQIFQGNLHPRTSSIWTLDGTAPRGRLSALTHCPSSSQSLTSAPSTSTISIFWKMDGDKLDTKSRCAISSPTNIGRRLTKEEKRALYVSPSERSLFEKFSQELAERKTGNSGRRRDPDVVKAEEEYARLEAEKAKAEEELKAKVLESKKEADLMELRRVCRPGPPNIVSINGKPTPMPSPSQPLLPPISIKKGKDSKMLPWFTNDDVLDMGRKYGVSLRFPFVKTDLQKLIRVIREKKAERAERRRGVGKPKRHVKPFHYYDPTTSESSSSRTKMSQSGRIETIFKKNIDYDVWSYLSGAECSSSSQGVSVIGSEPSMVKVKGTGSTAGVWGSVTSCTSSDTYNNSIPDQDKNDFDSENETKSLLSEGETVLWTGSTCGSISPSTSVPTISTVGPKSSISYKIPKEDTWSKEFETNMKRLNDKLYYVTKEMSEETFDGSMNPVIDFEAITNTNSRCLPKQNLNFGERLRNIGHPYFTRSGVVLPSKTSIIRRKKKEGERMYPAFQVSEEFKMVLEEQGHPWTPPPEVIAATLKSSSTPGYKSFN